MSNIKNVQNPDGTIVRVQMPDGATDQDAIEYAASVFTPKGTGPSTMSKVADYGSQLAGNIGPSAARLAARLAEGIYAGVSNPVDTGDALWQGVTHPAATAKAIGKYATDRFGSVDAALETLKTDPVGALADASSIFTGVGGVARGTGAALFRGAGALERAVPMSKAVASVAPVVKDVGSGVNLAGKILTDAGDYTNPLTPAAKIVSGGLDLAHMGLGATSRAGGANLQAAFDAARAGGIDADKFWSNYTKTSPVEDIVADAHTGLDRMQAANHQRYMADRTGNATSPGWASSTNPIDPTIMEKAAEDFHNAHSWDDGNGNRVSNLSATDDAKRLELNSLISKWVGSPANHTAEGLDTLKQRINEFYPDKETPSAIKRLVAGLSNTARTTIEGAAPGYLEAMRPYSEMHAKIREIRDTLGLGTKRTTEQSLQKMAKLDKDSHSLSGEYGRDVIRKFADDPKGTNLAPSIAGHSLSSWVPAIYRSSGIGPSVGLGELAAAPVAMSKGHPALAAGALAVLGAQSPKIIGGAYYGAGRVARVGDTANRYLGGIPGALSRVSVPTAANALGRYYELGDSANTTQDADR